jgi:hypothetical protein
MEASSLFRVGGTAIQNKNDSRAKIPSKRLAEKSRVRFLNHFYFFCGGVREFSECCRFVERCQNQEEWNGGSNQDAWRLYQGT